MFLLFDFPRGLACAVKRVAVIGLRPSVRHNRTYDNKHKREWETDKDLIRFGSPSQRSCITFANSAPRMRRGLTERNRWVRHF